MGTNPYDFSVVADAILAPLGNDIDSPGEYDGQRDPYEYQLRYRHRDTAGIKEVFYDQYGLSTTDKSTINNTEPKQEYGKDEDKLFDYVPSNISEIAGIGSEGSRRIIKKPGHKRQYVRDYVNSADTAQALKGG